MYGLQFLSPWTVVTPKPYRYLEKQYIEAFFTDGSLRLSSFAQFAQHEDEQRRDVNEGKTSYVERSHQGEYKTVATRIEMGFNAYLLCASTYYSESLALLFDRDSYLRIDDTIAFANAISRYVPGFVQGAEGLCVYEENPGIRRESETGFSLGVEECDGQMTYDAGELQRMKERIQQSAGLLPLFLKSAEYAAQAEYRLLWFTQGMAAPFLEVKVPEARQFCTPPPGVSVVSQETAEQVRSEGVGEELESMVEAGILAKIVPRPPESPAEKDAL
jgi:hypothetical protein